MSRRCPTTGRQGCCRCTTVTLGTEYGKHVRSGAMRETRALYQLFTVLSCVLQAIIMTASASTLADMLKGLDFPEDEHSDGKVGRLFVRSRLLLYGAVCIPELLAGSTLSLFEPLWGLPIALSFYVRSRPWVIVCTVAALFIAFADGWDPLDDGVPTTNEGD